MPQVIDVDTFVPFAVGDGVRTTDYLELNNKPLINGVTLIGNMVLPSVSQVNTIQAAVTQNTNNITSLYTSVNTLTTNLSATDSKIPNQYQGVVQSNGHRNGYLLTNISYANTNPSDSTPLAQAVSAVTWWYTDSKTEETYYVPLPNVTDTLVGMCTPAIRNLAVNSAQCFTRAVEDGIDVLLAPILSVSSSPYAVGYTTNRLIIDTSKTITFDFDDWCEWWSVDLSDNPYATLIQWEYDDETETTAKLVLTNNLQSTNLASYDGNSVTWLVPSGDFTLAYALGYKFGGNRVVESNWNDAITTAGHPDLTYDLQAVMRVIRAFANSSADSVADLYATIEEQAIELIAGQNITIEENGVERIISATQATAVIWLSSETIIGARGDVVSIPLNTLTAVVQGSTLAEGDTIIGASGAQCFVTSFDNANAQCVIYYIPSVVSWSAITGDPSNNESLVSYIYTTLGNNQADWQTSDSSSVSYIKNKPTIGTGSLILQLGNTTLGSFNANSINDTTIAIPIWNTTGNDSGAAITQAAATTAVENVESELHTHEANYTVHVTADDHTIINGIAERFDVEAGHNHDGVNSRKVSALDIDNWVSLDLADYTYGGIVYGNNEEDAEALSDILVDTLVTCEAE